MNPSLSIGSPTTDLSSHLCRDRSRAFSLLELLVVMAIIVIMSSLIGPAMNAIRGSGDLTMAASNISDALQQARAYAMAKNTYVYFGIKETDASKETLDDGIGRVAVAIVASKDGSRPLDGLNNTTTTPISRLQKFANSHIATTDLDNSGNMQRPSGDDVTKVNQKDSVPFTWPSNGSAANFRKVIEFDPQGVARYPTTLADSAASKAIDGWIEIPLQASHGAAGAAAGEKNQAAIQVDGMTGAVRVFRP